MACSALCQRAHARRAIGPARDMRGAKNPAWKGGASRFPVRYTRAFKAANPEKLRAQRLVHYAVRVGKLARPSQCATCARVCRPYAHHPDYAAPLSVEWLCRKCHAAADRARQHREAAAVRTGKSWARRHDAKVSPLKLARTYKKQSGNFVDKDGR